MKASHVKFTKKGIEKLIENYTRESGVRSLDKRIAKVMRSIAKSVAMEEAIDNKIDEKDIIQSFVY